MTENDLSLTAIHEASHCCLYQAFGIVMNGVRINSDGTGRVHRYNFELQQETPPLMAKVQDGAISVAGVVGEAIYNHGDVRVNAILTELTCGGGQGDYAWIQKCGVEHLLEALIPFTYGVLTEHWSKVLALATRLDEVQYLDSDEISSELPNVCDASRYLAELQKAIGNHGDWAWNSSPTKGIIQWPG
ncbi:hypothetical protein [Leptothoe kymatousa]|uniref:Uncharacterized protein n=1 Tax=Leptothoe kymatousa TAU-MAC 1615 TaxID=2364775 RepID=A0ABS5Y6A6_9CYAN|nr:hypothetical protein [Leptothoe kymatousa]MBT9312884.1 hypothetical protein [Leptothoe kymatousa TAU-MAC 1615]